MGRPDVLTALLLYRQSILKAEVDLPPVRQIIRHAKKILGLSTPDKDLVTDRKDIGVELVVKLYEQGYYVKTGRIKPYLSYPK